MLWRYWRFCGVKMVVSSANWRWVILVPFLQISMPDHRFSLVDFFIIRLRTSTAITKRKGDLLSLRSGFEGEPFSRTEAAAEVTQEDVHLRQIGGKPIWLRAQSRKIHETLPNALWKSRLKNTALELCVLQESNNSPAIKAPSKIYRPSMNDDWYESIKSLITFFNLWARSLTMIL